VSFSQAGRPFTVKTPLGDDKLLLERFTGEEAVSAPFHFTLEMVSKSNNVAADSLVRQPISVHVDLPDGDSRVLHGRVSSFVQLASADGLTAYRAEMVPWIWFLSLSSDCRIFQNQSALDIAKKVFDENGFADYQVKCVKSYPKREYCVQYRESHLDFVSRLMEDEGLFYFFEHSSSKHTLIIADAPSAVKAAPTPKAKMVAAGKDKMTDDALERVELETTARTGKVTIADYNPATPSTQLRSSAAGKHKEEVYDYPGGFLVRDQGDRYARLRLEEREAQQVFVRGEGNVRGLQAGAKFDLVGHYRGDMNKSYFLLRVWHSGSVGSYAAGSDSQATYRSRFIAIPADVPYHPPRVTPKPRVFGSQTAVVVGKSGEEIDVDKDGRVVVQFHWDRQGKKDEKSSIRVRVSSAWAGKGWGFITIPRIGQEVIVDFLEGDPDQPIIVGSVYNAEQMPPYTLPDNKTQSGVKSRSTLQGAPENFNELRFEDKKDSEEIYFHAEKDFNRVVENNDTLKVGSSKADDGSQTVEVWKDRTETVKTGNEKVTIEKGNRDVVVGMGNDTHEIKQGNRTVLIDMGNDALTIKMGNQTTKLNLGKSETEAMQSIELKVGQSSVKLDQTGVTIKGMVIKVEGQIQTELKGLVTQISGDAMLQAKGGIIMIG
jgi:type VI secretion system secreted protein VgrG